MKKNGFEKDVLAASKWHGESAPREFSWSLSRHMLFNSCKRAYFIRYHLAQGGWNTFSGDIPKSAYTEKYLKNITSWASDVFISSLESALSSLQYVNSPPEERHAALERELKIGISRRLFADEASLRHEEWRHDAKKLNLSELYYKRIPASAGESAPVSAARKKLSGALALFIGSDIFSELASIDPLCWKRHQDVPCFTHGSMKVYLHTGLVALSDGRLLSFDFAFVSDDRIPAEPDLLPASLFAIYASKRWSGVPPVSKKILFTSDSMSVQSHYSTALPEPDSTLSFISRSAESMLALHSNLSAASYPATDNRSQCAACQFAGTCARLSC